MKTVGAQDGKLSWWKQSVWVDVSPEDFNRPRRKIMNVSMYYCYFNTISLTIWSGGSGSEISFNGIILSSVTESTWMAFFLDIAMHTCECSDQYQTLKSYSTYELIIFLNNLEKQHVNCHSCGWNKRLKPVNFHVPWIFT